jgi:PAS domain S-box-containing protein
MMRVRTLFTVILLLGETLWLSQPGETVENDPALSQTRTPIAVAEYLLTQWGTTEGLPQNSVTAMAQTRDGYLWLGTFGGLARFDGVRFTVFDPGNAPGLEGNRILSLYEDRAGALWIGTEGKGLARYKDGRFKTYGVKDGVPEAPLGSICEETTGSLWVLAGHTLLQMKDDRFISYTEEDGTLPGEPRAIACSRQEPGVWIGTRKGLVHWREGQMTTYLATRDNLPGDWVNTLFESRDGSLWLAASGQTLARFVAGKFIVEKALAGQRIAGLFEDRQGHLWVGTEGNGLLRLRDGVVTVYTTRNGLADNFIRCAMEDREGNLWVGTETGGLMRLKQNRLKVFDKEKGLPENKVVPIAEGPDSSLWIGTTCGGVTKIQNGRVTTFGSNEGLPNPCVWSLLADDDGSLWIGTYGGGLAHLQNDKIETYTATNSKLSHDAVVSIYRSRDGDLWVGTIGGGLNRFRGGQFTVYRTENGLVHNDVRFITEDRAGALWIGTVGGLSRFKDGSFTNYTTASGLSHNYVRAIYEDSAGALWIGTYGGGLNRFKDGRFAHIKTENGLFDNVVSRILEDRRGWFWMTSNRGIFRASRKELDDFADGKISRVHSISYGVADGMKSSECNGGGQPAGWKTRDGKLWFPTLKGAVMIDPDRINELPPPVHIEAVSLDGKSYDPRAKIEALPGKGEMEIRYTGLSLTAPEKALFRYRLEGYDHQWIEAGTRRTAYYTNLAPGLYTFRVQASNDDGVWNETGAMLFIHLKPRFYQTRLFSAACVLAIGCAGFGIYRWRIRRLIKQTQALETKVGERTAELVQQKEKLAQAHAQLERAHNDVLSILNQLRLGVLITDSNGVVLFASQAAQELLGITEAEAVGESWEHLLPLSAHDAAQLRELIALPSAQRAKLPARIQPDGGRRYWVEIEVEDDPRNTDKKLLFLYDVTDVYDLRLLLDEKAQFQGIIGQSTPMQIIYKQISDLAKVETTVLIEGETGTGKELVARAIHHASERKNRPFIAVNGAGLTESILASQLFGHKRGAFTGAVADQLGLFEAANGGTIFLDEIGEMPLSIQTSLLRVLQEREIMRLGETKPRRIDVRVIAATNRDLNKAVADGAFRQDLFYRIRVAKIHLPPLRNRREDIPLLVSWFLIQARGMAGKSVQDISTEAMEALLEYNWPGNVRELKNAIETAVIQTKSSVIQIADLPPEIAARATFAHVAGAKQAVMPSAQQNQQDEKLRILEALRRAGGNRTAAARLLGIGRTTLYRKMRALGIEQEE